MNNQETSVANDQEVRPMKPWHKPQVNVFKMADAETGSGAGDDSSFMAS